MADVLLIDFARKDPEGFAAAVGREDFEALVAVLRALPPAQAVAVLARVPSRQLSQLISSAAAELAPWLESAQFDDAATLLSRLPRAAAFTLVNDIADAARRRRFQQFLHFPAHCVGAIATSVVVQVAEDLPVADVIAELRETGSAQEVPAVVLNAAGRFSGRLDLWKLLLERPASARAGDFSAPCPTLPPETNLSSARVLGLWAAHLWLPVVDQDGRVLGSVSREQIESADPGFHAAADLTLDSVAEVGSAFFRVSGELMTELVGRREP